MNIVFPPGVLGPCSMDVFWLLFHFVIQCENRRRRTSSRTCDRLLNTLRTDSKTQDVRIIGGCQLLLRVFVIRYIRKYPR